MKISIVIPRYKETEAISDDLFRSINSQLFVNFEDIEVVVVCDGGGIRLDEKYFSKFKNINNRIKYFDINKNVGTGSARNFGIELSSGDYILFIDQDDIFASVFSLYCMIKAIDVDCDNSDILDSTYMEEYDNNKFQTKTPNGTWIHGKLYRREFLLCNGILFPTGELGRYNEDSYFNIIALAECKTRKALELSCGYTVVRRFFENSLSKGKTFKESLDNYLCAVKFAVKELISRGNDEYKKVIVNAIIYYTLESIRHNFSDNSSFIEFYKDFAMYFLSVNIDGAIECFEQIYKDINITKSLLMEKIKEIIGDKKCA